MSRNPKPIESLLLPLKPESLQCIHRFLQYEPPVERRRFPKKRCAAVAIILFVGRLGDLYVLLSTRAGDMRTYAKDTALPGGKYEEGDIDAEGTARREAFEEVSNSNFGLPMDREKVRKLCLLKPFLTGNSLIVTPVVFLVTDNTMNPILNPSEVAHLFSMPLPAFLHHRPSRIPGWQFRSHRIDISPGTVGPPPQVPYANQPRSKYQLRKQTEPESSTSDSGSGSDSEPRSTTDINVSQDAVIKDEEEAEEESIGGGEGRYYQYRDVNWGEPGQKVRMHRFLTGREGGGVKPVYGLTAAILMQAAMVGYDQSPTFELYAPRQRDMTGRIEWEIRHGKGVLRRAIEMDGLLDDWIDTKAEGKAKL